MLEWVCGILGVGFTLGHSHRRCYISIITVEEKDNTYLLFFMLLP